jgi:peptide subunit release factor 1 (eRF1)
MEATSSERLRELRELAGFRALNGLVVSLYFGFDPAHAPTGDEVATRLASLVAQATRKGETSAGRLDHAERLAFERDLERVAEHTRRGLGPAGVACFADAPDGLWRTFAVRGALPDAVQVGSCPYLVPLVAALPAKETLVAVVSRELGEIYQLRSGRLERIVDLSEQQPGRHRDAQAWQQSRIQQHIDELTRAHLSRVAADLDRLAREDRVQHLVLAGEQKNTSALEQMLSHDARAAVRDVVHPAAHAGTTELAQLVHPILERKVQVEEHLLVERWAAACGRGAGAVEGWADTLTAASDRRIELLLFRDGAAAAAFECPACGYASIVAGSCPLDGSALEPQPDALNLAIRLTLAHGGEARAVRDHGRLGPAGIGALLNY